MKEGKAKKNGNAFSDSRGTACCPQEVIKRELFLTVSFQIKEIR